MRMFSLWRYEARLSILFIPTWWRVVSAHVTCAQCSQQMNANVADYQAVEPSPGLDVPALAQRTNPGLADRLKREGDVVAGRKLTSDADQTAFIADAVRDASRAVGSVSWGGSFAFWLTALVLCSMSPLMLMEAVGMREPKPALNLSMMVATVAVMVWGRRGVIRFLRRETLKSLAETLTPLQPTREEILRAAKTKPWAEREVLKYGGLGRIVTLIARAETASPVALGQK